jgi:hypothetical protein
MSLTPATRAITLGAAVLVVLLVLTALTTSWWNRHAPALVEADRAALAEGQRFGQTATATQCVDGVLQRHAAGERSRGATLAQRYFLQGCLAASPAATELCPRAGTTDVQRGTAWLVRLCAARHGDQSCPVLLQPLAEYCVGRSHP